MERNTVLKNVLQEENWESINKAPERMNTNQNNSLRPLESKSDNENEEIIHHNIQKLKETIDTLERIMNTKINDQQELLNQVVEKMNKMIANYNELESRVNNLKFQPEIKKQSKKSEEKKEVKDTSTMENEVNPDDVSIEKMFNFSNKKF